MQVSQLQCESSTAVLLIDLSTWIVHFYRRSNSWRNYFPCIILFAWVDEARRWSARHKSPWRRKWKYTWGSR